MAESETPEASEKRRDSVVRSSGETYLDILHKLAPGAACDRVQPADADTALTPGATSAGYNAVFLTGSRMPSAIQRRAGGASGASSVVSRSTRRNTKPASPATRLA